MSRESPDDINRRAAALKPTLFPELEGEDLSTLVRRLVAEAGYALDDTAPTFGVGVHVGDRASQVSCAALERLFLFDFWSKGVCYGSARTDDPRAMAHAIGAFVVGRATIDEMEARFAFIRFREDARAHEAGRLVDQRWRTRLESDDELACLLKPLFAACARRPRLRALFPFTSHEVVLFSRTTGYPYDSMRASARPVYDATLKGTRYIESFVPGCFEVFVRSDEPTQASSPAPLSLGTGDAEWAAATLEQAVPAGWGAAVDGTAEDASAA